MTIAPTKDWNGLALQGGPEIVREAFDHGLAHSQELLASTTAWSGGSQHTVVGQGANYQLIKSSREFIASYVAPSYLIDGILQQGRLYSLTGQTGAGKTAVQLTISYCLAANQPLGDHEVEQCRVLYFSGENPDDVKARWLAMSEHLRFDPDKVDVHFIEGVVKISALRQRIEKEAQEIGPLGLVIIDTSAAYFEGEDENSNVQLGAHARLLRELTDLHGRPCVLVSCHPVKNASNDNLLPRGGGAFLAEVDGNLTCANSNMVAEVHWQGKFRGSEFEPMHFELATVTSERVKDAKGRHIPTVLARPLTDKEHGKKLAERFQEDEALLIAMLENERASVAVLARECGWLISQGKGVGHPQKSKANTKLKKLERGKMAAKVRGAWELTEKGKKEAKKIKDDLQMAGAKCG